jgi:hypothetical protein
MRQNCLPQVVNRAISVSTTSVHSALMTHALATQTSESTISAPQSSDGVNISMPGSYRDPPVVIGRKRHTGTESPSTRPSRHSPSPSNSSSWV